MTNLLPLNIIHYTWALTLWSLEKNLGYRSISSVTWTSSQATSHRIRGHDLFKYIRQGKTSHTKNQTVPLLKPFPLSALPSNLTVPVDGVPVSQLQKCLPIFNRLWRLLFLCSMLHVFEGQLWLFCGARSVFSLLYGASEELLPLEKSDVFVLSKRMFTHSLLDDFELQHSSAVFFVSCFCRFSFLTFSNQRRSL